MDVSLDSRHIKSADVAEIVDVEKVMETARDCWPPPNALNVSLKLARGIFSTTAEIP
jgi:hypothetical protein